MNGPAVLAGLFALSFLAATVLPAQSEAALAGLLLTGAHPAALLVAVASLGNVAGSVVNWALGRAVERFRHRRWFPVGPEALARAQGWYQRWGKPSLLFAWLPGVGDAFTVAAGIMRVPLLAFLVMVTIAKGGRYAAVLAAGHGLDIGSWF